MTDTELNEAIAGACGWKSEFYICPDWHGPGCAQADIGHWTEQPDYCHDLNAMHEAENCLEGSYLASDYEVEVRAVLVRCAYIRLAPGAEPFVRNFRLLHATARQRAEAFARVKGVWKE